MLSAVCTLLGALLFGRRGIEKDRQRASSAMRRSIARAESGDLVMAVRHSADAEACVERLMRHEPENTYHRFVLAGLLYNRATILDRTGEGAAALAAARAASELYEDLDPSHGDPSAVEPLLRGFRDEGQEMETLIAHAADARARFARLLAKNQRASAAAAARQHGRAAVRTYEVLARAGQHFSQADVDRVREQYRAVREHLGEPDG
ncbi:hypothetical protein [Sciscionella marina]|uniref:hypothetical protein n=1 Tax=Sciscionella marina TaxID=508770 RepID=UPI0012F62C65|nr:hypothetical protein [Sciscionella marina]